MSDAWGGVLLTLNPKPVSLLSNKGHCDFWWWLVEIVTSLIQVALLFNRFRGKGMREISVRASSWGIWAGGSSGGARGWLKGFW